MRYALILLALLASPAYAAKVTVSWTNPDKNTNGTPLTDLASIIIEWGTCNGTAFGETKGSALVATNAAGASLSTVVTPTGLDRVCLRALAVNINGVPSAYSNVAVKDLLPQPGKPITLGQPIILSFNQQE